VRKPFRSLVAAGVLGLACGVPSAGAAVLLNDTFDSDAASSILNFTGFANWNVVNGTVDYIRSGGFGISCVGGSGGCVDLDGSTSNVGRMVSKISFVLDAATAYRMSLAYSGNQRGGNVDGLRWGLTNASGDVAQSISNLSPGAPFVTNSTLLSGLAGTFSLFIEDTNATGDNIGPILDNVVFESVPRTTDLPVPGTLALLALGLAGLRARRPARPS